MHPFVLGTDISSRVIAVWCNTMEPTLQSSGQAMTLEFQTDSTNTYRGFRLKYFQTSGTFQWYHRCCTLTTKTFGTEYMRHDIQWYLDIFVLYIWNDVLCGRNKIYITYKGAKGGNIITNWINYMSYVCTCFRDTTDIGFGINAN